MAAAASVPSLRPAAGTARLADLRVEHLSPAVALRLVRLVCELMDVWQGIRGTGLGRSRWEHLTPAWRAELQRADGSH